MKQHNASRCAEHRSPCRPRIKGRFVKSQGQSAETGEKAETAMSDLVSNLESTAAEVDATPGEAEAVGNNIKEQEPS